MLNSFELQIVSQLAAHTNMYEPGYASMGVFFRPSVWTVSCGLLSCKDACGMKGAENVPL